MTEKVHPAPEEGEPSGDSEPVASLPEKRDKKGGRSKPKSGSFTWNELNSNKVDTVSKKKARHKADSIFDVGKALEKKRSVKGGIRRHTMMAISQPKHTLSVLKRDGDGKGGTGNGESEDGEGKGYFDLKKTARSASLDIKKDVGELNVILEALDPQHQANLKRHMKSALGRVTDNLKHLNFLQDRADHMALKMVRATNWAHSKEVRKKRLTIGNITFAGDHSDHNGSYFGKISGTWTMAIFCLLTMLCMLLNQGHPVDYTAFDHLKTVSPEKPYTKYLNSKPLDVIQVALSKDSYSSDTGFVTVQLEQELNTTTTSVTNVIGQEMIVDLSSKQINTFHFRFFPKRSDVFNEDRPLRVVIQGPFNSNLDAIALKAHIEQHGPLGLWQEYIAATVLCIVLGIIALELLDRTLSAMIGASLMIGLLVLLNKAPDLKTIISWCDEGTLGLLFGMMVIVSKLSLTGFMDLMTYKLIPFCNGSKYRLLYILCAITAVMSAFLDNVTTVLLVAPLTVSLSRALKMNPLPFLTGEVLFSNIGGTATLIGDPPNVIVGSRLSDDLTFLDFIVSLGPAVILMSLPCMLVIVSFYRKELSGPLNNVEDLVKKANEGIKDPELFNYCMICLVMVLFGFLLHPVHHVNPAWIAISGAILLLIFSSPHDIEPALESVEWSTLLFFASLFVMVEAMAEVGLISTIGQAISDLIESVDEKNRLLVAIVIVLWISALVSAFLDNIPYTATMVPIIVQLASNEKLGLDIKPLAWSLCFGACLGGNGSLMGASANIVVAGIADKSGYPLTFTSFFNIGFRVMIVSVTISTAYMLLVYCT
ncbi:citrate transporter [Chloropicon primus]|uniref:Citrate transporter-like domain-containing protein n=1 Tax=Chloropicon primus TaxID=1764295 RepID=A0A5B8MW78_9CHLO|nr:hypothetical protein A3770_11p63000 [Chloropicon primus]UPR02995.1 citrate transporter [Chloropicon primus]|eukprot:QDZ23782.1 hypothetical protein A3770_11p63000 [Chloropicon primus]